LPTFQDIPKPERKGGLKKFIRRETTQPIKQAENSSDEDDRAPKGGDDDDFGNYEEEIVPIAAKPFLFGPVDKWALFPLPIL